MKGRLVKIKSTHKELRTDEMIGDYQEVPTLGKEFVIFGKPLNPAMTTRMIRTTPIQLVCKDSDRFLFETENSSYELHIMEDK